MKKITTLILLFCFPFWLFAGIDYDGTDDQVTVADSAELRNMANLTISCWIILDTLIDQRDIVVKVHGIAPFYAYRLYYNGGLVFQVVDDVPAANFYFGATISADTWYHVAAVFENGQALRLYIDGVLDTDDGTPDTPTGDVYDATGNLYIGSEGDSFFLNGEINEVAIWDNDLTVAEIVLLASSKIKRMPLQIQPSNLQLYLPFDDEEDGSSADGDTFLDMSGNGNTATGDDGGNDAGLIAIAETVLTYP